MIRDNATAVGAARVGYESAYQFNREFRRLFGRSFGAEALEMRTAFALMEPESPGCVARHALNAVELSVP